MELNSIQKTLKSTNILPEIRTASGKSVNETGSGQLVPPPPAPLVVPSYDSTTSTIQQKSENIGHTGSIPPYPYPFPSIQAPMPSLPSNLTRSIGCSNPKLHFISRDVPAGASTIHLACGCTMPIFPPGINQPVDSGIQQNTSNMRPDVPGPGLFTKFVNPSCHKPKKSGKKTGKKRKRCHCKKACTNCRKAHTACDNNRPCKRCQTRGLTCYDEDDMSKPKKKLKQDNNTNSIQISTIMTDNFERNKGDLKDPKSPVCFSNPSFKGIEESINELKEINQLYSSVIFRLLDEKNNSKKDIEHDFRAGLTRIKMKEKLSLAIPVSIWDSEFKLVTFNDLFKKTLYVGAIQPQQQTQQTQHKDIIPPPNAQQQSSSSTVSLKIEDFLFFESEGMAVMRPLMENDHISCFKVINVWKNRERQFDFVKSDFFRSRCGKYFWASHLVVSNWDQCVCINETDCRVTSENGLQDENMSLNRESFIMNQKGFNHVKINISNLTFEDEDSLDDEGEGNNRNDGKRRKRKKKKK